MTTPSTITDTAADDPDDYRFISPAAVLRPAKGRLQISLPEGKDTADIRAASRMLMSYGPRRVVLPDYWGSPARRPWYEVSRVYTEAVIQGLLAKYRMVTLVTEHFATEICSAGCYSASSAEWLCTCGGCAARNHGRGAPRYGWRLRSEPDDRIETDGPYLTRTRVLYAGGASV